MDNWSIRFTLFLLTLSAAVAVQSPSTAYLEQAREAGKRGATAEALDFLVEAKIETPDDVRPYLASARLLLEADRKRDAELELTGALRRGTDTATQAYELSKMLQEIDQVALAAQTLQGNQDLDREGLWLLTNLLHTQRRFEEALDVLEKCSALTCRSSEEIALLRGKIFLEQGALERSMVAFEEAVDHAPQLADAYHGLSKVCLYGNNYTAARKMARYAVELDPENSLYLYQLGLSLKALGETTDAIRRLEEAKKRGADPFGISFELGNLYRREGKTEEARSMLSAYQDLLRERRQDQRIRQLLQEGEERLVTGKAEAASRIFQQVLELDSSNWTAHNRLAKIYLNGGSIRAAESHLEKLLELDSESSEAHYLYAVSLYQQRRLPQALQHGETSRRLRPDNAPLRNLLGNLYYAQGRHESALQEYRTAAGLEPQQEVFRRNYEAAKKRAATTQGP